jgi:hypothetical protein
MGLLVGPVLACDDQGPGCDPAGKTALIVGTMGGMTALAGAAIGLAFKTEKWEALPTADLRTGSRSRTGPRLALGVTVRF